MPQPNTTDPTASAAAMPTLTIIFFSILSYHPFSSVRRSRHLAAGGVMTLTGHFSTHLPHWVQLA